MELSYGKTPNKKLLSLVTKFFLINSSILRLLSPQICLRALGKYSSDYEIILSTSMIIINWAFDNLEIRGTLWQIQKNIFNFKTHMTMQKKTFILMTLARGQPKNCYNKANKNLREVET